MFATVIIHVVNRLATSQGGGGGGAALELELELRHAGLAGEVVEDVGGGADGGDAARHDAEMQARLLVRRLLAWLPGAGRGWGGRSRWRWGRGWVSAAGLSRWRWGLGEEELEWICSHGGEGRGAQVVAEMRGEVGGRREGRTGRQRRDLGEADGEIGDGSEVGAEREKVAAARS